MCTGNVNTSAHKIYIHFIKWKDTKLYTASKDLIIVFEPKTLWLVFTVSVYAYIMHIYAPPKSSRIPEIIPFDLSELCDILVWVVPFW